MGNSHRPALRQEINEYIGSLREKFQEWESLPAGIIGNGYKGAIGAILQVLGNPIFFEERDHPTLVRVLNPQKIEIESQGPGIKPLWLNLARSWESDDVLWSFNFLRRFLNRMNSPPGDPFEKAADKLTELDGLCLLSPFSKLFSYQICCDSHIFENQSIDGQFLAPGQWKTRSRPVDFRLGLEMDSTWFV